MKSPASNEPSDGNAADSGLNENHVRHVVTTFRYTDELLSKAEHIMASAGVPSPFQEYADDTTPIQRKVTHDYIARLRELMSRNLAELHIPRPASVSGALWAARNAVTFADIALAEMESKRMGGYGKMSDEAAQRIDAIVAELRTAVEKLSSYLAQGTGADLQARLQRLEKTSNEVPLLRELDRIITAHGLVEFRNAVVMLLERMENGTFEIGVFGRVSSGKSSLLNHLLGSDYLPVGVTPVTAVPTRISFGARPQVFVEFADGRPQVAELSALAEFATEQQNPGNAKHVSRIRVELPAAKLGDGITFVDTPGLGSLATSGAEETVAYLPRCDLGIVLVDAASTLTHEDLKVIEAIYQAGATAMVLVSKADMLNPADRQRAMDYVRKQILSEVNVEPPVHLVSVLGNDVRLCDEWFESVLRPLLDAHRELTVTSLKRKIGGLREALLAALKRRPEKGVPVRSENEKTRMQELEREFRKIPQTLEAARREAEEWARSLHKVEDRVIELAADELAASWLRRDLHNVNPAKIISETVTQMLAEESGKVRQHVEQTRVRLAEILQDAARVFPSSRSAFQDLPKPAGLPLCDPSAMTGMVNLHRPAFLSLVGQSALRRYVQTRLRDQISMPLHDFLGVYSRRLTEWAKESFGELETPFSASAGIFSAQLTRYQPTPPGEAVPSDDGLAKDILRLERWGQTNGSPTTRPA
jgi:GTP-binding protein EngB required for normal cell division